MDKLNRLQELSINLLPFLKIHQSTSESKSTDIDNEPGRLIVDIHPDDLVSSFDPFERVDSTTESEISTESKPTKKNTSNYCSILVLRQGSFSPSVQSKTLEIIDQWTGWSKTPQLDNPTKKQKKEISIKLLKSESADFRETLTIKYAKDKRWNREASEALSRKEFKGWTCPGHKDNFWDNRNETARDMITCHQAHYMGFFLKIKGRKVCPGDYPCKKELENKYWAFDSN